MVAIGQKWLYLGKKVVFVQSGCIWAKLFVFGQIGRIRAKVVVFEQNGYNRANFIVFGKVFVFVQKLL